MSALPFRSRYADPSNEPLTDTASSRLRKVTAAALFVLTLVFLRTQVVVKSLDPLQYAGGFLVTGDYAVGSVDLTNSTNPSSGGFSTGTINISGVPANADILAAICSGRRSIGPVSPILKRAYEFNGSNVVDAEVGLVKRSVERRGHGRHVFLIREPVVDDVGVQSRRAAAPADADGPEWPDWKAPGQRCAHRQAARRRRREPGSGKRRRGAARGVSESRGHLRLNPLRRIVVYEGLKRKPDLVTTMTQTLRGFYGPRLILCRGFRKARITHIAASGNRTERANPVQRFN